MTESRQPEPPAQQPEAQQQPGSPQQQPPQQQAGYPQGPGSPQQPEGWPQQPGHAHQQGYPQQPPGQPIQQPFGHPAQPPGVPNRYPGHPVQPPGVPNQQPGYPIQHSGASIQHVGSPNQPPGFPPTHQGLQQYAPGAPHPQHPQHQHQHPQHPHLPSPPPAAPPAPRKINVGKTLLFVALGVLLVVGIVVGLLFAAVNALGKWGSSVVDGAISGQSTAATVYVMNERPGWDAMETYVVGTLDTYSQAAEDGTIFDMTPNGRSVSSDYYAALLYQLTDLRSALRFAGSTMSTDAAELDDRIQAYVTEVEEIERRFAAGEDLDVTVQITDENGEVREYSGDRAPAEGPDGAPLASDPETYARGFAAQPDADGSYASAAQLLAAQFGREVSFDYSAVRQYCIESDPTGIAEAGFCAANPSVIYVNDTAPGYPQNLSSPAFIDVMKHELAHAVTFDTCGTPRPPITGTLTEGVTSSYAVLFFGADFDELQSRSETAPEYTMTEETDRIARALHDGQCS
ncbi:hypothetical protein [Leucobacter chromiiresistens]|uniref:Uncharacterized protein n=1 Tax=Leucobacter chromiiresistens TaxID=1079994 RepID=A0A1H0Y0L1_9MICO|nr:hypothetical protein [Leucobacter chromiiresistens]SDQ08663.1 hypothetical protein SAMN04488565_0399 [Leucobacter chromiiresistens]